MPRLVFFTDTHYTRHPPACRSDSYPQEILQKFHDVAALARKLKAKTICHSGDWFHRKGKVTFREANDVLSVLSSWHDEGLDVVGILGNHDIAGHSLDSLDTRAVGTLVHSKVLTLLDYDSYMVSDFEGKVLVTGTSYFHGCDSNDENRLRMYGAARPEEAKDAIHVHLAHGTLLPRGEFFEDYTLMPDLLDLLAEHDRLPDVLVCGHLHFPQGVNWFDRPGGHGLSKVAMVRPGSIARVSSDDFDRLPYATVLATRGKKITIKLVEVGKDVSSLAPHKGDEQMPAQEHADRIQEFVRILREEADMTALHDYKALIEKVATDMGFGWPVIKIALKAIDRRQG